MFLRTKKSSVTPKNATIQNDIGAGVNPPVNSQEIRIETKPETETETKPETKPETETETETKPETETKTKTKTKLSKTEKFLDIMDAGFRIIAQVGHLTGEPIKSPITAPKILKEMKELTIILNEEREHSFKVIKNINHTWRKVNNNLFEKFIKANNNSRTFRYERDIYKTRVDILKYENEIMKYQLEFAHSELDFMQKQLYNKFKINNDLPLSKSPLSKN